MVRLPVLIYNKIGTFYTDMIILPCFLNHLVGLVVKESASRARAEDPGFESCLRRDFFGVESYQ